MINWTTPKRMLSTARWMSSSGRGAAWTGAGRGSVLSLISSAFLDDVVQRPALVGAQLLVAAAQVREGGAVQHGGEGVPGLFPGGPQPARLRVRAAALPVSRDADAAY